MPKDNTAPATPPKVSKANRTSGSESSKASTASVTDRAVPKKGINYLRWAVIMALISLSLSLAAIFLDKPIPIQVNYQIDSLCGEPLKTVQPWQIHTFRPKWLGLFGNPAPLTYRTKGNQSHQIAIIDVDKRDIEIRTRIDGQEDRDHEPTELDHAVHCGDDVAKCVDLGFASAIVVVPPGEHTVTAEIVHNPNEPFHWGDERKRKVVWTVQECP